MVNRYKTRNLKSLFPLKDKDLHFACKIYKGICSCEPTYVGDVEVIYLEHNHPSGKSEPSKHLHQNINLVVTWSVIRSAPKIDRTRIWMKFEWTVPLQCFDFFRNGITWLNFSIIIINWSVFCFLSCFMIDFC